MRILETRPLAWPNEAACEAFAAAFAKALLLSKDPINASIELHGQLGAGKTSLVRHLLRALGVEGRIKSPSYAVLESYDLSESAPSVGEVSHFDFYRFNDPREWEDAGFRDIFAAPGLKLCEWPEKASGVLPSPDLRIWLEAMDDDSRQVRLEACSEWAVGVLQSLEVQT